MLQLTATNFNQEMFASPSPAIVMFYANWCSKCAMMKPVFETLEMKYRSQIKFCVIDFESCHSLTEKYQIEIVPTFIFFKDGQIEAAFDGLIDESMFDSRIKKIFRNC